MRTRLILIVALHAKLPKPPIDDSKGQSTDPDAIKPAFLPVTTELRAMEAARLVLQDLVGDRSNDQAPLPI